MDGRSLFVRLMFTLTVLDPWEASDSVQQKTWCHRRRTFGLYDRPDLYPLENALEKASHVVCLSTERGFLKVFEKLSVGDGGKVENWFWCRWFHIRFPVFDQREWAGWQIARSFNPIISHYNGFCCKNIIMACSRAPDWGYWYVY